MTKRVISITLALIMLLGVFSALSVSAEEAKILATKTLKVGQSADVGLTHPDTGAKLSTIWESTNPSIATVTADGKVTGKKAGTCTVTTWWNSKLYGVNVVVKAAAKKTTSAKKTSAYTKLANYLKKNGTKTTAYGDVDYTINWKEDGYLLWSNYRTNNAVNIVITIPNAGAKDCYSDFAEGIYLNLFKSGKRSAKYFRNADSWAYYKKTYKKGTTVNTAKLNLKYQKGSKLSTANSRARTLSKAGMSLWNKFLKARVGLTVKKLGFVYKKGKAAKKISISKKSATLKAGKKLTLKLKNATASKVKWSSSKKAVATVSKKGVVKGKKAGKATITAKYKSKKYKCKVTVKKKSKTSAFNKVKNFIIKNGSKVDENDYSYSLGTKGGFKYNVYYYSSEKYIAYYAEYENQGVGLYFENDAKAKSSFYEYGDGKYSKLYYTAEFKKSSYKYKTTKLTYKDASDADNNMAIGMLSWAFSDFNSYTKKKAGVTMKQLGFKNWDI